VSAAAPAASAPYDTNVPGAAGYLQADLMAKTAYQNSLTRINGQRQQALQQAGYTGGIDPNNGTITGLSVDANNPFGGYQQLLKNGAVSAQAAQDAAQQRGLGHGGLAAQGMDAAKFDFGNASNSFGTQFQSILGDLQGQQSDAAYARDQALWSAQQQAAQQAIAAGDFNPAMFDFTPADYSTPSDGSTAPVSGDPNSMDFASELQRNVTRALGGSVAQQALDTRGAGMNFLHGNGTTAAQNGNAVLNPVGKTAAQRAAVQRIVKSIQPQTKTAAAFQPKPAAKPAAKKK